MKKLAVLAIGMAFATGAFAQITNGGFETGDLTGWTVDSSTPAPGVTADSHTGQFAALLGTETGTVEPLGNSSMFQSFAVGAGGTLSFWTKKNTTDSITFDWQDAYIRDSGGNILQTIFHTCSTAAYAQTTVNMNAFAGQTVQIAFLVHQDGFGDVTGMKVDDVSYAPVPEPATYAVLGVGALALIRRRRSK